jgi:hypothetical protein
MQLTLPYPRHPERKPEFTKAAVEGSRSNSKVPLRARVRAGNVAAVSVNAIVRDRCPRLQSRPFGRPLVGFHAPLESTPLRPRRHLHFAQDDTHSWAAILRAGPSSEAHLIPNGY